MILSKNLEKFLIFSAFLSGSRILKNLNIIVFHFYIVNRIDDNDTQTHLTSARILFYL